MDQNCNLPVQRRMRTVLIHNPTAGSEGHAKEALLHALGLEGAGVVYCSTKQGEEVLADALREEADLIVVVGGDGTVARVLTGLPDRRIPVAILPLGTANNIARSMSAARTSVPLQYAERILHRARFSPLNVGSARGPWGRRRFVEGVGVGPLAQAIRRKCTGKASGTDGLESGRKALRNAVLEARPLNIEVSTEAKVLARGVLAVEVVNITCTGPALPLAPFADPGDGKLDVLCLLESEREAMAAWLEAPQRTAPPLLALTCKQVAITGDFPYQRVDDEVFDPVGHGSIAIELEPDPVRVIVLSDENVGDSSG
jgi:diacylglycerol kinase family enzyme